MDFQQSSMVSANAPMQRLDQFAAFLASRTAREVGEFSGSVSPAMSALRIARPALTEHI